MENDGKCHGTWIILLNYRLILAMRMVYICLYYFIDPLSIENDVEKSVSMAALSPVFGGVKKSKPRVGARSGGFKIFNAQFAGKVC